MSVDKEAIAYRQSTHIQSFSNILSVTCPYNKGNLP